MKRHVTRTLILAAAALALLSTPSRAEFAASAGNATQINRYDDAGNLIGFDTTSNPVRDLAFGRAGNLLVLTEAAGGAGTISGVFGPAVAVGTLGPNPALAASQFGGFAFSAGNSTQINRYDDAGNLVGFDTTTAPVQALAFGIAGNLLALTGNVGGAGTLSGTLGGSPVAVGTLGINAALASDPLSGSIALSLGGTKQIDIYNANGVLVSFTTLTQTVQSLAYDRAGNLLALLGDVGGAGTIIGVPGKPSIALGTLGASPSLAASRAVPEPSSLLLCGFGLAGLSALGRPRRLATSA